MPRVISQFVGLHKDWFKVNKRHADMIFAPFGNMDFNIALRLVAALVLLTLQPYDAEGRNIICRKDQHKLQKRSGDEAVLIESYEVTPRNEERGSDCREYEPSAFSPTPAPPIDPTTRNRAPNTDNPAPTPKKTSQNQMCWLYSGKPVRLYLPIRNPPTFPNPQGNKNISGGMNGSGNSRARVVCGKLQRVMGGVPKVLLDYGNGNRGKHDNKGAMKPMLVRPAMAIHGSPSRGYSFYDFLRDYQRLLAAQRPKESSASSHCGYDVELALRNKNNRSPVNHQ